MSGLMRFDYGDLSEREQNHFKRISKEIREIQGDQRRSNLEATAKIGERLADGQSRLSNRGNGTFQRWVEAEFDIVPKTAYRAIAVWDLLKVHDTVSQTLELSAAYLINEKACPEAARKEVLRLAENGHIVTHAKAKEIVEKYSPSPSNGLPAGYSPHGTGSKAQARSKSQERRIALQSEAAASVALDGDTVPLDPPRDPDPWPGDGEQDEQDAPAFAAPVLVETTAKTVAEDVTASDLLPVVSSLNARVKKVTETIDGDPFDGKEAAKHCIVIADMLTGETPKWRLVKAGDVAGQAAEIFDLYPRKVARDKALVEIRKALRKVSFEELKEAVSEYARSRAGKDEQFTPHPATWFGEGRWADDRRDWFRPESNGRGPAPYKPGPGERFDPNAEPGSL